MDKSAMGSGHVSEQKSGLLTILPPVEFCCVYGSTLHPNNHDETRMIDYIIGVGDPVKWHSENLKLNPDHYASFVPYLGGAKLVTHVANRIGVGVHFNPFVSWNDRTFKYGVVRMHDLIEDILHWEKFYFSGRLQKPVNILVDTLDIEKMNSINLRAATSAALLHLPCSFTEEDLYAKICSLSYMGDIRMLFAEDKHKVKKIVQGQFDLFRKLYKPILEELATKDLLTLSLSGGGRGSISQDCGLHGAKSLVSYLPKTVKKDLGAKLGKREMMVAGRLTQEVVVRCREETANCMQKILRRKVMFSSARQALAGSLIVGPTVASEYLTSKLCKAWNSRA
ncbi:hypothetical protein V2J09_014902 [Rumex salicifolius]